MFASLVKENVIANNALNSVGDEDNLSDNESSGMRDDEKFKMEALKALMAKKTAKTFVEALKQKRQENSRCLLGEVFWYNWIRPNSQFDSQVDTIGKKV